MTRRPLSLLTAVSLLLLLAVATLWVRSHWRFDHVRYARFRNEDPPWADTVRVSAASLAGVCCVAVESGRVPSAGSPERFRWFTAEASPVAQEHGAWTSTRWGFAHHSVTSFNPAHQSDSWFFPLWLPAMVFSALPAWLAFQVVRRRARAGSGRCGRCGYDLRASPGRCPECGTPAADL